MAKLRVSASMITDAIFPGAGIQIVGAKWDYVRQEVVFDIEGHGIPPGAQEVRATMHSQQISYEFHKVERRRNADG